MAMTKEIGLKKITVNVQGGRAYDILVGHDTLADIGQQIKTLNIGTGVFLITSPRIGGHYLPPLLKSLKAAGYKDILVNKVPDGEKHKDFNSCRKLTSAIVNFNRDDSKKIFVLNLGGGVVGDLGGYIAATFKRGIDYIQVPTTLLAFVDCGIGGKVGINFNSTKNIIGAFHQPRLVYADLNLLKTLNRREMKSGLAEVVKYGVISKPELFELIENHLDDILSLDEKIIERIATQSYGIKADIVAKDEFDTKGIRATLNYGHTLGHAIEAASKYAYRHGEALSIGMVCANDIAVAMRKLDKNIAARIENLLTRIGLPVSIKKCKMDDILDYFWRDKKFVNGKNRLVFATAFGKTEIVENVPMDTVKSVIKKRYATLQASHP
jgi:3-dehydroquinate synthase